MSHSHHSLFSCSEAANSKDAILNKINFSMERALAAYGINHYPRCLNEYLLQKKLWLRYLAAYPQDEDKINLNILNCYLKIISILKLFPVLPYDVILKYYKAINDVFGKIPKNLTDHLFREIVNVCLSITGQDFRELYITKHYNIQHSVNLKDFRFGYKYPEWYEELHEKELAEMDKYLAL